MIKELSWPNDISLRSYCLDEASPSADLNLINVHMFIIKTYIGAEMTGSNSGVKVSCSLIGPFNAKIHHEHTFSKV